MHDGGHVAHSIAYVYGYIHRHVHVHHYVRLYTCMCLCVHVPACVYTLCRNTLTYFPAPLDSGCLAMLFLETQTHMLLEKSRTSSSGSLE